MQKRFLIVSFILLVTVAYWVVQSVERSKYDFRLQSESGDVSLSTFHGKVLAIYFGYTHCPDICPTSLTTLELALKALPQEEADQIQVLFVSVDPNRDTPKSLKTYVEYFHPSFIGATASKEVIDEMISRYDGSAYTIIEDNNSAMGYSVGHTSFVYFFDKDGHFVSKLNHSIDPKETALYMRSALTP